MGAGVRTATLRILPPSANPGGGGGALSQVRHDPAVRLDHVSYAVAPTEFVDAVQRLGSALGAGFVDGGRHPRYGTRNFVLPLAGGTYLEVVTVLDHPATEVAPFARAVRERAALGGGWLGWVVAVDDIRPFEARLGRSAVGGHRIRPDGVDLTWQQLGVKGLIADPQLPFFIQWLSPPDDHPSSGASGTIGIAGLQIAGDPDVVAGWLGAPAEVALDGVGVEWIAPGEEFDAGLISVTFSTPRGRVVVD